MIRELLKSCGYPPDTLVLDAETYQDKNYNLKKLSTYEYVTDSRFEELGWAAKYNNRSAVFKPLPKVAWRSVTVIMHNAPFDALILALHYSIYPPFIIDTLDLARHIEPRWSNKLADLCERHRLPSKGDTSQFTGIHAADLVGQTLENMRTYATNDAEREYDLLKLLLPRLSNPKFELEIARYTRDLFIKPVLSFNVDRARQLKSYMLAEVQEAVNQTGLTETQLRSNKFFESRLREVLGPDEEPPMKQGKRGSILAIAKTDPGHTKLLNHPNKQARELMEARVAVKSWPLHIKRIARLRSTFECAGKRLPIPLKYYGAHTGRWSGTEKINLQNLPARGHPLVGMIRTLIEAPLEHTLIILDFSQIEARVLDYLAEQNDMLKAFAEGRQIYCEFASELTGRRIRKPKKTDKEVVAKWHNHYRQMGKVGILGCGYGMGADHCQTFAQNIYGIHLTHAEAEKIIKLYRRTHPMVILFWEKVERAFRMATQTSQAYELPFGLRFFREADATIVRLPSTRQLYYTGAKVGGTARYPQLVMPDPASTHGKKIHFWGGYLTENIVQAVSRDILAEAVLKIEKLGVRIPLIVHDDMSVVVPETEAKRYQSQIEDIVRTPPNWLPNLPIDVDCRVSKEYSK